LGFQSDLSGSLFQARKGSIAISALSWASGSSGGDETEIEIQHLDGLEARLPLLQHKEVEMQEQEVVVTCPEGVTQGQDLQVMVGDKAYTITVPKGVASGQQFQETVRVPKPTSDSLHEETTMSQKGPKGLLPVQQLTDSYSNWNGKRLRMLEKNALRHLEFFLVYYSVQVQITNPVYYWSAGCICSNFVLHIFTFNTY
jgi:hypothetical protein